MTLKIDKRIFEDVEWNVDFNNIGDLRIKTDESIPSIISSIGSAESIETYDGENLTGKWINHGIESINKLDLGRDGMMMEVRFRLTTISQNTEKVLQSGIDESVDAMLELAELYSELETAHSETQKQLEQIRAENLRISNDANQKQNDMDNKYNERIKQAMQFDSQISDITTAITRLEDRINAIPTGILDRFAEIDNRLNVFADRIAVLENRG